MAKSPQRWPHRANEVLLDTQVRFTDIDDLATGIQRAAAQGKIDLVIAQAAKIRNISIAGRKALTDAALGRYA